MSDTTILVLAGMVIFAFLADGRMRTTRRRTAKEDSDRPELEAQLAALKLRQNEVEDYVDNFTKRETMRERRAGGSPNTSPAGTRLPGDKFAQLRAKHGDA